MAHRTSELPDSPPARTRWPNCRTSKVVPLIKGPVLRLDKAILGGSLGAGPILNVPFLSSRVSQLLFNCCLRSNLNKTKAG
jgi:hypothetical protein